MSSNSESVISVSHVSPTRLTYPSPLLRPGLVVPRGVLEGGEIPPADLAESKPPD